MKLRYLALSLVPLLLLAACASGLTSTSPSNNPSNDPTQNTTNTSTPSAPAIPNFADAKISEITNQVWTRDSSGAFTGDVKQIPITDAAVIKKVAETLDDILNGKVATTGNMAESFYTTLRINFADGSSVIIDAHPWYGIWVDGKQRYACTEAEFERLQAALDASDPGGTAADPAKTLTDKAISGIVYHKMAKNSEGSLTGEWDEIAINNAAAVKKIAETLDAILNGKRVSERERLPAMSEFVRINYDDGNAAEFEICAMLLIRANDKYYDLTQAELDRLQNALDGK